MYRVSEYDNAAFFNEYAQMPRSRVIEAVGRTKANRNSCEV